MTILVRKAGTGIFQVVNGIHQLIAQLQLHGRALVQDIETHEDIEVHEVGGEVVALNPSQAQEVKAAADVVIAYAAKRSC